MAEAVKTAGDISKEAAASTSEQRSQFKTLIATIGQVTEKLRETFLLSTQDKERYNETLTAPHAPTVTAPATGEALVHEPD